MTEPSRSAGTAGVTTAGESDREIVIRRVIRAPRALVFDAWVAPAHLARWWRPHGFTCPVCEFDARPGGRIRIDITGADGAVHPMGGEVREVARPGRLVFVSTAFADEDGVPGFEALNTVTFEERDGRTTVTVRSEVLRATAAVSGALAGMEPGWAQSLERLDAVVSGGAAPAADGPALVVRRELKAPRDLVFRAWTEPELLARWFGPRGSEMLACRLDLRPGGLFHYAVRSPDGREVWGKWVFRAIEPPDRLVFVASFADAQARTVRAPFGDAWPLEVLAAVTFEERDGRTTVTLRGVPRHPTEAECRGFEDGVDSMERGWAGTLDQLEAFLAIA